MHPVQKQLIDLIANNENIGALSLRKIAELLGVEGKPQIAKYHLGKLEEAGLIQMNLREGVLKLVKKGYNMAVKSSLYSIPVVGSANCGPATVFADERIEGYLKVSSKILPHHKSNIYALKAVGSSMNEAKLESGDVIEEGDLVLVDKEAAKYKSGDIVVAVIDGMANIKRYHEEKDRIVLRSESTEDYLPIVIHEGDDFLLSGKVVGVIKS